ncbi:MAG TPA: glycoside hydrolase family 15 protein, partial [Chryseosolibacter sp.]|nr:glycoside hydrolase family 15 protein [Chryseosolibacter sp.]
FDRDTQKFIIGLGKVICEIWDQPDNGIWEIRSQLLHHTHSKVMCWVGLDRLIKLCEKYQWHEAPLDQFRQTSMAIRREVEASGFDDTLGAYVAARGSVNVDASSLTFSLVGYAKFDSPRMMSTVDAVCRQLLDRNMVYRYKGIDDGIAGSEGAFALCNFWLVENLARSGSLQQARRIFEATISCMGSVGLLSEEIDPATTKLLGNYPQAFTHIGLVNAALAINEEQAKLETKQRDNIILQK